MSMSKKHFEAIAKAIRSHAVAADELFVEAAEVECSSLAAEYKAKYDTLHDVVLDLCDVFKSANANFDAERFINACGVSHSVGTRERMIRSLDENGVKS